MVTTLAPSLNCSSSKAVSCAGVNTLVSKTCAPFVAVKIVQALFGFTRLAEGFGAHHTRIVDQQVNGGTGQLTGDGLQVLRDIQVAFQDLDCWLFSQALEFA